MVQQTIKCKLCNKCVVILKAVSLGACSFAQAMMLYLKCLVILQQKYLSIFRRLFFLLIRQFIKCLPSSYMTEGDTINDILVENGVSN